MDHTHEDEFRSIYGHFNSMTANLKNLIDLVFHQKILVQRPRLKQLQSVNPPNSCTTPSSCSTHDPHGRSGELEVITARSQVL
jgi:hypothetical protein